MKTLKECTEEALTELLKQVPQDMLAGRIQYLLERMDLWDRTIMFEDQGHPVLDRQSKELMQSFLDDFVEGGELTYTRRGVE